MSKKVYFKNGSFLYTEREARELGSRKFKKVLRSKDEFTTYVYDGNKIRFDNAFDDGCLMMPAGYISTKQLRNRKIARQMLALGLI